MLLDFFFFYRSLSGLFANHALRYHKIFQFGNTTLEGYFKYAFLFLPFSQHFRTWTLLTELDFFSSEDFLLLLQLLLQLSVDHRHDAATRCHVDVLTLRGDSGNRVLLRHFSDQYFVLMQRKLAEYNYRLSLKIITQNFRIGRYDLAFSKMLYTDTYLKNNTIIRGTRSNTEFYNQRLSGMVLIFLQKNWCLLICTGYSLCGKSDRKP